MAKIISISTAVPQHEHEQMLILEFMKVVYQNDPDISRKLSVLYKKSNIDKRYSVLPDFNLNLKERQLFTSSRDLEPMPGLESRMSIYLKEAPALAMNAIKGLNLDKATLSKITHLITVSCTGMAAPGIEMMLHEQLGLNKNLHRSAINFMGCYAAVHALKQAHYIANAEKNALVLIVSVELCTLHFQKDDSIDALTSSLLFADGAAAVLVANNDYASEGIEIKSFYSEVITRGKKDMAWELSSEGFRMTLTGYVPKLIKEDLGELTNNALSQVNLSKKHVNKWCIHPGGKAVLEAIKSSLNLTDEELRHSTNILRNYGNVSSATILFVLHSMWTEINAMQSGHVFGAAFGPGLNMESFILCK